MGRKLRLKLSRVVWPRLWLLKLGGGSGNQNKMKAAWYCRFAIARAATRLYNYRKNAFLARIARTRRQGEAAAAFPLHGSSSPSKSNSLQNIAAKYCNSSMIMSYGGRAEYRKSRASSMLIRKDVERWFNTRELERKLRILAGGERYSPSSLISSAPLIRSPKTRISAGLPSPVHTPLGSAASKELAGTLLDCDIVSAFNCERVNSRCATGYNNCQNHLPPLSRTIKYSDLHRKSGSNMHRFNSTLSPASCYSLDTSPSPSPSSSSPSSPSSSSWLESTVLVENYSDIRDVASSSSSCCSSSSFASSRIVFHSAIFDRNNRRRQLALEDKLSAVPNGRRLGSLKGDYAENEKANKLRQITADELTCNNNVNICGGRSRKSFASCKNMAMDNNKLSTARRRRFGADEMNMETKTRLRKIAMSGDACNDHNSSKYGHGSRKKSFASYINPDTAMEDKLPPADKTSNWPLLHCDRKSGSETWPESRPKMQPPPPPQPDEDQYSVSIFNNSACSARIKKAIRPAKSGAFDRFAMAKLSYDLSSDFKQSMAEMMREKELFLSHHDLQDLLKCYLSLNSCQYHGIIIDAFRSVLTDLLLSVHAT